MLKMGLDLDREYELIYRTEVEADIPTNIQLLPQSPFQIIRIPLIYFT